jgi:hypothetical protein
MIGMRPAAYSTASVMSVQCSSTSTVGDSPVVPTDDDAVGALLDVPVDERLQAAEGRARRPRASA